MSLLISFRSQSKTKKNLTYFALVIFIYALLAIFALPWFIQKNLPDISESFLEGRDIQLESIEVNPFYLTITLHKLAVKGLKDEPFAGFDKFHVNLQLSTVFTGTLNFHEVALVSPYGHIDIDQNGVFNIDSFLNPEKVDEVELVEKDAEADDAMPAIFIHNLHINAANFFFTDATKSQPFSAQIGPLDVHLEDFSTQREQGSPYQLNAKSANGIIGSELAWEGSFSVNPLMSEGELSITDVNLPKVASYLRDQVNFEVQEGLLDLNGKYSFDYSGEKPLVDIHEANINIDTLRLGEKSQADSVLNFPTIQVAGIDFNLDKKSVAIKNLIMTEASYDLKINDQGELNLQTLFTSDNTFAESNDEKEGAKLQVSNENESSNFSLQLDKFQLVKNNIRFLDASSKTTMDVELADLDLELKNINLLDNNIITLNLAGELGKDDETGELQVQGSLMPFPLLNVDVNVILEQQPIVHFERYIHDVANIKIASGLADVTANIKLVTLDKNNFDVIFTGDLAIKNLLATADNVRNKILSLDELSIKSLQFESNPLMINASTVSLVEPKVWLVKSKTGKLNIEEALEVGETEAAEAQKIGEALAAKDTENTLPKVKIDNFEIKNAAINLHDYSVSPLFAMELNQLSGSVNHLSSSKATRAVIDLNGKLDSYAPVILKGQLNMLSEEMFSDITVSMKNVNMTTFTPYSSVYIGREINKGKLDLGVVYQVDNRQLIAKNILFLDQFTLGGAVKSEQKTKLPVQLGVSLLKNSKGEIHIDLPIKGDLDDPDFRYGKVVWKTLGNLLVKAAASPFTILAGIVNSKADLSYIGFSAGDTEISSLGVDKLKQLEQALLSRPTINIEIEACYQYAEDKTVLQHRQLLEKINPDNDDLSPEDLRHKLSKLFKHSQHKSVEFPQYSEALVESDRIQKDIEFLESQLQPLEEVSVQQVQVLAIARQQAIRNTLLASGEIAPERLFLQSIKVHTEQTGKTIEAGSKEKNILTCALNLH